MLVVRLCHMHDLPRLTRLHGVTHATGYSNIMRRYIQRLRRARPLGPHSMDGMLSLWYTWASIRSILFSVMIVIIKGNGW